MSEYMKQEILVTELLINNENPRFEPVKNQREAIDIMLKDQIDKIYNLSKDIVENGINPSELTIVTPIKENGKTYFLVLEGNRRIIAIKLLINHDILPETYKSMKSKFKKLAEKVEISTIKNIECVIFFKKEDAFKWIKLKHTGENSGVGTVSWDAQQISRFDAMLYGKKSISLQVIDFLRSEKSIPQNIKDNLDKIPVTNLDRLISDKNIQDVLSIEITEGVIKTDLLPSELGKGLSKIASDLISKKIKVKDIYSTDDRERYIETFKKDELPNKKLVEKEKYEISNPIVNNGKTQSAKKSIPLSVKRKSIIPKNCIMKIEDKRINAIYTELKSLDCEKYKNAAAVLLRVFVELSMDAFITARALPNVSIDDGLSKKVQSVTDYLQENNLRKKDQLKGIRSAVSHKEKVVSIDTFHAYVHNRSFSPIPDNLKISWDNIQDFIEFIWVQLQ